MLATTIPTEPTHNQPTHLLASRDTLPSEVIRVSLTHGGKEEDAPGRERPGEPDPQDAQVGEAKLRKIYMVFAVGGVILVQPLFFMCANKDEAPSSSGLSIYSRLYKNSGRASW